MKKKKKWIIDVVLISLYFTSFFVHISLLSISFENVDWSSASKELFQLWMSELFVFTISIFIFAWFDLKIELFSWDLQKFCNF